MNRKANFWPPIDEPKELPPDFLRDFLRVKKREQIELQALIAWMDDYKAART